MTDTSKPFAFSQFVPGFDFLKSLTGAAASGVVPGMPSLSNWVAPTLSVEEIDKRIKELRTVQFWLEQNVHALKATIQALEVQKMTLSTLQGMNVRMEDLANAFARSTVSAAEAVRGAAAAAASAPAEPPQPAPEPPPPPAAPEPVQDEADAEEEQEQEQPAGAAAKQAEAPAAAPGVIDPLQWWGALTQQFREIASNALQDAAHLRMPVMPGGDAGAASAKRRKAAAPAAARKTPAKKKAPAAARAPARKTAARARPKAKAAPASRR